MPALGADRHFGVGITEGPGHPVPGLGFPWSGVSLSHSPSSGRIVLSVPGRVSENHRSNGMELVFFDHAEGEINESDYRLYTGGLRRQCHA
jgi:hypothetical protein